jgi:hypothetical protein
MHDATAVVYTLLGLGLSIAGGVLALTRGRAPRSFYATDVYHMTMRSHRRFALLSAAFASGFLMALFWPVLAIPLLAVYTLLLVIYASSFARGFSGEDE